MIMIFAAVSIESIFKLTLNTNEISALQITFAYKAYRYRRHIYTASICHDGNHLHLCLFSKAEDEKSITMKQTINEALMGNQSEYDQT